MMGQSQTAVPAMNFAKEIAAKNGCELLFLSDNEKWYKYRELVHFGIASPEEFVGLIAHAECVVTNSFHATAFSIMLHKEFWVETEVLRNNRILNLLKICGMDARGLRKGKRASGDLAINWNKVDSRIQPFIQNSREYLQEIIAALNESEKYMSCDRNGDFLI